MTGSTIFSYLHHSVILGQGGEKGPLTITSAGKIVPSSSDYGEIGLELPAGVASPTVINSGYISGGPGNNDPYYIGGIGVFVAAGLNSAVIDNFSEITGGGYSSPTYGEAGGAGVVLLSGVLNNENGTLGTGVIYGGYGAANGAGAGGDGGVGVTVGSSATLNNPGNIYGGTGGTGTTNGGNGGDGVIAVAGANINNSGLIKAGYGATGTTNGGNGADGITVGAGAILNNSGYVYGGMGGTSTDTGGAGGTGVSITNGVVINSGTGDIYGGGGGASGKNFPGSNGGIAVDLSGGTLITAGNITGGVGQPNGGTGGTGIVLDSGVAVNNGGEILGGNGSAGGTVGGAGGIGVYLDGGTLINSGTIAGGNGGVGTVTAQGGDAIAFGNIASTLVVYPGAMLIGAVVAQAGVADLLEFAGTGPYYLGGIGTQLTNFNEIDFAAGTAWTIGGDAAGLASGETINGFVQGDTIILSGFAATAQSYIAGTGLVLSNASGSETLDLTGNFSSNGFAISDNASGGTDIVACFAAGTRIATARGNVAVEQLEIGDFVKTLHAGMQKIKFIGRRSYGAPFVNNRKVLPICIRAGALGQSVPARDLHVSPGHAICIDGVLVHAEQLINGLSIWQAEQVESVTYFHIELDRHEVIFAENCPAETFMDEKFRNLFQNAAEFSLLYPGETAPAQACLPVVGSGFQLQAIWRRIAARAGAARPARSRLGRLRGYIDTSISGSISGWAQDEAAPEEPVCLDVLRNGQVIARVLANGYRADLRAAGLGSGRHGFALRLPVDVPGVVEVRRAADGCKLAKTEACLAAA